MVMYSSTSKLNPTFGMIGKATADKMTATVVGKLKLSLLEMEIGPYFQLNSANNFSANRSVVDSNYLTWACYVLEKYI